MTVTPTSVQNAVYALEAFLLGEDTQVFFAPLGAVVLTDEAAYEVYSYDEGIIIQTRPFTRAEGWDDITRDVVKHQE